jgi:hypothetical protein
MSSSYAVKKLLELNEKISGMTDEEVREVFGKDRSEFDLYEDQDKTQLGDDKLDIHSPDFLRET